MSTFTRVTTPPFSVNPLQRFVTLKQARRAAKSAGVLSVVIGASAVLGGAVVLAGAFSSGVPLDEDAVMGGVPVKPTVVIVAAVAVIAAVFFLLAWWIFRRPGPIKVGALLIFLLLNLIVSALTWRRTPTAPLWGLVFLNFAVVAFRGALAMKRLKVTTDENVF